MNLSDEELNKMYRADGELICSGCGKEYWRHPMPEREVIPTLRRLCNGDLVKL